MRYTLAVDFDGVVHMYTTPFQGEDVIPDPPVPGAIEALNRLSRSFTIVIHTTRGRTEQGAAAVRRYLHEHGYRLAFETTVTAQKVPALLYIDDRGYRFDGTNWPTAHEVHAMRPWNKPLTEKSAEDA